MFKLCVYLCLLGIAAAWSADAPLYAETRLVSEVEDQRVFVPLLRYNDQLLNLKDLVRDNLLSRTSDFFNVQKRTFVVLAGSLLRYLRYEALPQNLLELELLDVDELAGDLRNELDLLSVLVSQPNRDVRVACKPKDDRESCLNKLQQLRVPLLRRCPDYQGQVDLQSAALRLLQDQQTVNLLSTLLNVSLKEDLDLALQTLRELEGRFPEALLKLRDLRALLKDTSLKCLLLFNLGDYRAPA